MADGFLKRIGIGRRRHEPARATEVNPALFGFGRTRQAKQLIWKPSPRNLRFFSRTPYARRAINAIKNPIAMLDWEIVPAPGVKETPELKRQIAVATYCLANPNRDDSWRTLAEQVLEDTLIGAGALETQVAGDANRPLWIWPVDGLSIQIYPAWSGDKNEARYAQTVGTGTYSGGGPAIQLRDDELIYIRPNPTTASPFGLGPLEVAFNSISRQLGVSEFAGNVTTNAKPSVIINLGEGADATALAAFRAYWTNEIEGQGKTPIMASKGGSIDRLYPEGDTGLFLAWQEFLKTEIAIAFDLSPMNLGVERDVNRSTAEVGSDRDWEQAIKPRALELASYITRHALHRRLGFYQLQMRFIGLDREDEKRAAEVFKLEFDAGGITPNEYRKTKGRPPLKSKWADLTGIDLAMAKAAATGSKQVFDPDLPERTDNPPKPAPEREKE